MSNKNYLKSQKIKRVFSQTLIIFIFFTCSLLASFYFPLHPIVESNKYLLTSSTFTFSIFVGSLLTRLIFRFNQTNTLIAQESALYIYLYRFSTFFDKRRISDITEIIDDYYRKFMDLSLGHVSNVARFTVGKIKNHLRDNFQEDEIKSKGQGFAYQRSFISLEKLDSIRKQIQSNETHYIPNIQWIFIYGISIVLIYSIFMLRDGNFNTNIIASVLITAVFGILLVCNDYFLQVISGKPIGYDHILVIFDIIKKPRYYHLEKLKKYYNISITAYPVRIGVHNPINSEKEVYLIKNNSELIQLEKGNKNNLEKIDNESLHISDKFLGNLGDYISYDDTMI